MSGLWHLSDVDCFEDLSAEQIREVERVAQEQRFEIGQTVFSPSSDPRSVYLLKEGTVRIYRLSEEGAEATFGYVRPEEVFGELAAITGRPRESYAEAASPAAAWRLPIELFRKLLGSRPGIGVRVTAQVGTRLKRIENRVEGLMLRDARSRLAIVLSELGDHFGVPRGDSIEIDGDFTQSELATLVGCSRQTLNQCLRELGDKGIVEVRRQRIRVLMPNELRAIIGKGVAA